MSADFMLSTGRMPIGRPENQPQRREPMYDEREIGELVAYVASLSPGPAIPVAAPATGDLSEGGQLYSLNCAACHSSTGAGATLTSGLETPSVLSSTPRQIAEAVRLGGAGLFTGNMPRFEPDDLSDQELDSLIRYIGSLQQSNDPGGASLGRIGPIAEGLVACAGGLLLLLVLIRWIGEKR